MVGDIHSISHSMSDFKQQVANQTECHRGGKCEGCDWNNGKCIDKDRIDTILAAHNKRLDEIAEGLPYNCYEQCAVDQRLADKAHVKGSKEEM